MKPPDRYFNYAFIVVLSVALLFIWYFAISDYANEKYYFELYERGKDGIRTKPGPIEQWNGTIYWLEWFLFSLIAIVPLVISLFRLKYYYKTWLTVLYYVFVTIYSVQFIHLVIILLLK